MMNRKIYYFFTLLCATLLMGFVAVDGSKSGSLKEAFKNHYLIGAAINGFHIQERDPKAKELIERHFNTITAENEMKWQRIQPSEGDFKFEIPDKFVDLGEAHNMFIVGHTLVWHSQLPRWVLRKSDVDSSDVEAEVLWKRMEHHISAVAGRYKGRVHGWDVLNEALNEDGTLRQSGFLKILGPDYIAKAFEWAHAADPNAELYYNDYNMANAAKMDGAIKIAKELQEKGIRIDGIGMQGHWSLTRPSIQEIEESILKVSALGLKVMITELDISVLPNPWDFQGAEVSVRFENRPEVNPYTEGLPDSVQTKLAERYAEIFTLFNKHKDKISRVTFWGVHDGYTWLNNWPVRGRTNYPMLFDRNAEPKPAFAAVMNTVAGATQAADPKKKKK